MAKIGFVVKVFKFESNFFYNLVCGNFNNVSFAYNINNS